MAENFTKNRLVGDEEEKTLPLPFKRSYKKLSSYKGGRWLETWIKMGVRRPVLHLRRKDLTICGTKPDQLELQLTSADVFVHASDELRELAKMASDQLKDTGLDVKIMDKHYNKYHKVAFEYDSVSDTYRFSGPSFGEFLSSLKDSRFLDIWGLPKSRGDDGVIWFALVDYS